MKKASMTVADIPQDRPDMHLHQPSSELLGEDGVAYEVEELLRRIDRFLAERNWSEGYFGKLAAGSDLFVPRLRESKKVQVATVLRAEKYLNEIEEQVDVVRAAE